jgi:hypothetical protein
MECLAQALDAGCKVLAAGPRQSAWHMVPTGPSPRAIAIAAGAGAGAGSQAPAPTQPFIHPRKGALPVGQRPLKPERPLSVMCMSAYTPLLCRLLTVPWCVKGTCPAARTGAAHLPPTILEGL